MLVVPHHPPRLAQLSGDFCCESYKNAAKLLVRMTYWVL